MRLLRTGAEGLYYPSSVVRSSKAPPDNPLQAMFLRAWTQDGYADAVAAAPHAALDEARIRVSPDVAVTAHGFRSEPEHLCRRCQLAVPSVHVAIAPAAPREALSSLDRLFAGELDAHARALAAEAPRDVLRDLGLELTSNVRVRIRLDAPASSLELQLCAAFHACLCDAPELEPIVFANWHE